MDEQHIPIKKWSKEERPREKLVTKGVSTLSNVELLSILLRCGNKEESALSLARRILSDCGNDFNRLARFSVRALCKNYRGIGIAKSTEIIVAMEIGRRRILQSVNRRRALCSSTDSYKYISPLIKDLDQEEFWVIYLNRANHIQGCERISQGGMSSTIIDIRVLFVKALEMKADAIIVAHNHPSGFLHPSEYDKAITEKIKDAGQLIDIPLYDHLIIGGNTYYSFLDEGMLERKLKVSE